MPSLCTRVPAGHVTVVVVVVEVSLRGGEEENITQPDSNVDARINTLSFLLMTLLI
jgi:hypothetical protein